MGHKKQFKTYGTCVGWTLETFEREMNDEQKEKCWAIMLMFKDALGNASILEQVVIEIDQLHGHNNVEHIPKEEIFEKAQEIINLIKKN